MIVRQGVQDEVVNRARRSVLFAETRRNASWKWGGVVKVVKMRFEGARRWEAVLKGRELSGAVLLWLGCRDTGLIGE